MTFASSLILWIALAPSRIDVYGDALPPGARARLGTVRFRSDGPIAFLTFTPDGHQLVSGSLTTARFWDPANGKLLRQLTAPPFIMLGTPAISSNGKFIAFGGEALYRHGPSGVVFDATTGNSLFEIQGRDKSLLIGGFTYDNEMLVTHYDKASVIDLFDVRTGQKLQSFEAGGEEILKAIPARDGKTVISASRNGPVRVWDR